MPKVPDTPWHVGVITKGEDDPRRLRNRCKYYEKYHYSSKSEVKSDYCRYIMTNCFGSAHCDYYEKKEVFSATGEDDDYILEPGSGADIDKGTAEKPPVTWMDIIPVGSCLYHQCFKLGTVIENDGKKLVVLFDDGITRKLQIVDCVKKRKLYQYDGERLALLQESDIDPQ